MTTASFTDAWMSHYVASPEKFPLVYYVNLFYKVFIPLVIGGMLIFVVDRFYRAHGTGAEGSTALMAQETSTPARELLSDAPAPQYIRFSLSDRVQHLVMLLSFTTLAITGLVQKYALSSVSIFIIRLWGGIENVRTTHHVAATVLMLVAVTHLIALGYKVFVLRRPMTMLPSLQDVKDAWTVFAYNMGLGKTGAQMGRYTFEEKAEYWALVWGIVIMGLTGFMMWNPLATVKLLPGEFIPAAKAAHGAEALLAVLAIIVWHMYGVHLKRFNKSMWTGQLDEDRDAA